MKSNKDENRILTVVIASIFLISIGMISHNAFADQVVATIHTTWGQPDGIAVNSNTNMIYVTTVTGPITVINGSDNSILNPISINKYIDGIAANPTTNKIYFSNTYPAGYVGLIDGTTNTVSATIPVNGTPGSISVNPTTNKIYVVETFSNTTQVIDGSTNTITDTISGESFPNYIAVNPTTNKIYVEEYNGIQVIDGSTDNIISTIPAGTNPVSIAVDTIRNMIYVANHDDNTISIIDGSIDKVVTTISTEGTPLNIAVNSVTDKIYVPLNDGTVEVLDGKTNSMIQKIPVGNTAVAMDVNSVTNMMYADNQNGSAIRGQGYVTVIQGEQSPTTSQIQVNSQDNNGNPITGFYTELYASNGTQIDTGYTPQNFTLYNNQNYTVHVEDYGKYMFDHWLDTGSTDANRTISTTSDSVITATYKTVPQPPTGLVATGKILKINLSWNAPTDDGGSAITGYVIERSTDGGSTWSTIQSNTDSTGTTYSDTSVLPLITYTYRVSAINDVGTSNPSNTASASALKVGLLNPSALP